MLHPARRFAFRHFLPALALGLAVGLVGCTSESKPASSDHAHEHDETKGLQWPELRALDEFAHEVEHLIAENRLDDLRKLAPEIRGAAEKLAAAPAPNDAPMRPMLEGLVKEIGALGAGIGDAEKMSDETLKTSLEAFHPLVLKLMETAGMAHVHEHGDHDGHKEESKASTDGGGSNGSVMGATAAVYVPKGEEKARLHEAGDTEHEHEPGPHGGYVFHLSPAIHGELVIDPATGRARVYALDIDEKATTLDDPMSAYLELVGTTNTGASFKLDLGPDGSATTYAYFETNDATLKGATSITGRLTGRFRDAGMMATVDRDVQWPPPPIAPQQ